MTLRLRRDCLRLALTVFVLSAASTRAEEEGKARVPASPKAASSCALVEKFGGDLQVLDSHRTIVSDLRHGTSVDCGGWISTDKGWITVTHRDGAQLTVGPKTFVGLRDDHAPGKGTSISGGQGDHVILYRGEVYGVTAHGALNVITPNARARLAHASAIVVYDAGEEDSQLIALEDQATLENRFEPERKIAVKEGEASSLNFRLLRVVPSAARAVARASLKGHLVALHVEPHERSRALARAYAREERRLAANLPEPKAKGRMPASEGESAARESGGEKPGRGTERSRSYERNPADPHDAELKEHMISRITGGGGGGGEQVLYPEHSNRKQKKKAKIQVEDADAPRPDAAERPPSPKEEEAEKRRLIDALSKVNED